MAAKTDMERIGVFSEMGYLLGDKYKPPSKGGFNDAAGKGKQMLPGGSKTKSAARDGYFADFGRVFEHEAYTDYIRMRRMDRIKAGQKNIGKAWTPSSNPPIMPGLGTYIGTLGGKVDAFSPAATKGKSHTAPPRNFTTRPGKQGTGYGYADVTIGKVPGYQTDAFERARDQYKKELAVDKSKMKGGAFKLNGAPKDFFDENPYKTDKPLPPVRKATPTKEPTPPFKPSNPGKLLGGGKFGTFDPYPQHPQDKYPGFSANVFRQQKVGEKVFMPSAGPKSYPINSVVNQMVTKTINETNVPYQETCY